MEFVLNVVACVIGFVAGWWILNHLEEWWSRWRQRRYELKKAEDALCTRFKIF